MLAIFQYSTKYLHVFVSGIPSKLAKEEKKQKLAEIRNGRIKQDKIYE